MRDQKIGGFAERLESQAEARKALLAKFKPKPTVTAEVFETRAERKARELEEVRAKRAADKEAARLAAEQAAEAARKAAEEAAEAARLALENNEEAQLELKRQERKDRKAVQKEQARAKKDRLSAYKNMKISA